MTDIDWYVEKDILQYSISREEMLLLPVYLLDSKTLMMRECLFLCLQN